MLDLTPIQRLEQGMTGGEMAVERPDADPRLTGHAFEARIRSSRTEDGFGGLEYPFAVANGVRPRFPACGSAATEPCSVHPLKNGGPLRIFV